MARRRNKRTCGVYIILCKTSGYAYIGSSKHVEARFRSYRNTMSSGTCHNRTLQFAFDVLGADNFTYDIVCECSESEARNLETRMLKTYKGKLFNILRDSRNIGPVSEETRKKLSKRAKAQHAAGNLGRQSWKNSQQ